MKKKLEALARVLEKRRQIARPLQSAETALKQKRYTRAKLIAQQVPNVEPENKQAKRVVHSLKSEMKTRFSNNFGFEGMVVCAVQAT